MLLFLNVIYVLIAVAMIALILMQRGAGAQAGSGFGGGASATVFGARGASSFLTKATKWLAIVFFSISMYMAWHATNSVGPGAGAEVGADLGVMSQVPVAPETPQGNATVPSAAPQVPADEPVVPAADAPATEAPQSAPSDPADQ